VGERSYRQVREQYEKGNKPISVTMDSEGRVVGFAGPVMHSCHVEMPAEMITDPWTGQPKVFTEEEKAEFDLADSLWSICCGRQIKLQVLLLAVVVQSSKAAARRCG
jgi:hypothetical protein